MRADENVDREHPLHQLGPGRAGRAVKLESGERWPRLRM
jgi:hypothetical protein